MWHFGVFAAMIGDGMCFKMLMDSTENFYFTSYTLSSFSVTFLVGWMGGLSETKTFLGFQPKLKLSLAVIVTFQKQKITFESWPNAWLLLIHVVLKTGKIFKLGEEELLCLTLAVGRSVCL